MANDFRSRAKQQARAIVRARPDLVALQEVLQLGCIEAGSPQPDQGCNHPLIAAATIDHLGLTLDALRASGGRYRAAAIVENLDLRGVVVETAGGDVDLPGVPVEIEGVQIFLTALDRDAILVNERTVPQAEAVEFPQEICRRSLDGCNFEAALPLQLGAPGGVINLRSERGFVAVDAEVRGHLYRLVNTHLEVFQPAPDPASRFFQAAQATELLTVLEATTPQDRNLIVAGDINSSPEDTPIFGLVHPYQQLVDAGLVDVWTFRPNRKPGFTCCQAADLSNPVSLLDTRIDVIFSGAPLRTAQAKLIGDRRKDKTRSGLWPSDHAGIVARIMLQPQTRMMAAR